MKQNNRGTIQNMRLTHCKGLVKLKLSHSFMLFLSAVDVTIEFEIDVQLEDYFERYCF